MAFIFHLRAKSFLGKIAVIQRSKLMSVERAGQIDLWGLELKLWFKNDNEE